MKKHYICAAVRTLGLVGVLTLLLFGAAQQGYARNYAKAKYNKNRWKVIGKDYLNTDVDRLIYVRYQGGSKAKVEMWKKVTVKEKVSTAKDSDAENMTVPAVGRNAAAAASASAKTKTVKKWKKILSCSGYVGKNGINKEKEGDKKTPTGAFHITMAFGRKKSPGTAGISYTKLNKYHYWSGEKETYNTFVDVRKLNRTWVAGEHLITYNPFYNYSLAMDFNKKGVYKKGSAIFMHCSKSGRKFTAGCVAISQSKMKKVVKNTTKNTMIFIYPDYPKE